MSWRYFKQNKKNPEIITELSKNYEIIYYSGEEKKTKPIFLKSTVRLKDRDWHGTPADAELTEGSDAGAEIPAGGASGRFPHHSGGGVGPLQLGGGHLWPSKHTLWGGLLQGKPEKYSWMLTIEPGCFESDQQSQFLYL